MQDDAGKVLDLTLDLRSYAGDGGRHSHDYHQLVLPLEGRLELELEAGSGAVETGKNSPQIDRWSVRDRPRCRCTLLKRHRGVLPQTPVRDSKVLTVFTVQPPQRLRPARS